MALATELMARGMQAELAKGIGQEVATGLTAAGTGQTTALVLTTSVSMFTTVSSSTGALLPVAAGKAVNYIYNGGSNALTVYPSGTATINGSSSFSVTASKGALFVPLGLNWLAVLSA